MEQDNKIVLFQDKSIRRHWHNEMWHFVINDIIEILTNTTNVKQYWQKLNKRDPDMKGGVQIVRLLLDTEGGKQPMNCANTEGVLRIIQSIPSPNAEPFKRWMAQVGYERIKEIENPELGFERLKEIYKAKGYSNEWIETRLKTIDIRKQLTDEWKGRGVKEGQEYSILTAEIAKATFGLTPSDHKKFKGLETQNLRDHMSNLELIFTMLGEETTRRVVLKDDALGFEENHEAAQKGGYATGEALKRYEQASGELVVSPDNFLNQIEEAQKKNIEKLPPQ
jgi:DNA-damage-inducible protein D